MPTLLRHAYSTRLKHCKHAKMSADITIILKVGVPESFATELCPEAVFLVERDPPMNEQ